jgi:DNA-binding transcriptional LysR family regulator
MGQARCFVALADTLNAREAAALVGDGMTPRGVTKHVERLAETIGSMPFTDATWRGEISLTGEGRDALPLVRRFLAATNALYSLRTRPLVSTYPAIAGRLIARRPDLIEQQQLILDDISDAHRRGGGRELVRRTADSEVDIAIAPSGLSATVEGVTESPLYAWRLRIVLPRRHAKAKAKMVTPAELANLRFVASPPFYRSRQRLNAAFQVARVELDVAFENTNQRVLQEMATNSAHLAAAIPDDAFNGAEKIGPVLHDAAGEITGEYAIYVRSSRDELNPSPREVEVDRLIKEIHKALKPKRSAKS